MDAFWRGQLSPSEVTGLIAELPPTARLRVLLEPSTAWGATDHLLARVIDELRAANWMYISAHLGKGDARPDAPMPIPRPGETKKSQTSDVPLITDVQDIRARLAGGGVRTERLTER